jgi:fucose 4-O-acetylase-like acetyltransferase
MIKRLLLLNALGILAVILNHTCHWGYAMVAENMGIPIKDVTTQQLGILTYYGLLALERIGTFTVPAFLFVSGFFSAYSASGDKSALAWKTVLMRVLNLVIPYAIWSIIIFTLDALIYKNVLSPLTYIARMIYGGATPEYFFVPMMCQFIILAPFVVPIAKTKPVWLLVTTFFVMLIIIGLDILNVMGFSPLPLIVYKLLGNWSLFIKWSFYFSSGLVACFYRDWSKGLQRYRWLLFALTLIFFVLQIVESEILYRASGNANWRDNPIMLTSVLYTVSLISCYFAFVDFKLPLQKHLNYLGNKVFGIYLVHNIVIVYSARGIERFAPFLINITFLNQAILYALGLGIPLLLIQTIVKTPAKRIYKYLFG